MRWSIGISFLLLLYSFSWAANPTFDIKTVAESGVGATLRTADFDNDGAPDLVALTSSGVAVFFNDGQANFTRLDLPATKPGSMQLADFDGDGRMDIAVATNTATTGNHPIVLFLNNGDRAFRTVNATTPSWTGENFAAGDINGDGKADIVLALDQKTVSVMLGNGDGTFQSPHAVYTVTPSPQATDPTIYALQGEFITGDFNGDGRQDIAFSEGPFSYVYGGANITVLLNQGNLTFTRTQFQEGNFESPVLLDANGDGIDDLGFTWAACHTPCHGADVWTGSRAGTMNQLISFFTSTELQSLAYTPVAADFNGDGARDVAFAMSSNSGTTYPPQTAHESVLMFLGPNIPKQSPPPSPIDYAVQNVPQYSYGPAAMVTADFNLDGKPDIAIVAASKPDVIALLLNTTAGGAFPAPPRDFTFNVSPAAATVKAGNSATFTASVSRFGAFSDIVNFSCTGLPSNAACNFSPANVAPGMNGPALSTLTITTKAPGSAALMGLWHDFMAFAFLAPIFGVVLAGSNISKQGKRVLLLTLLVGSLIMLQACAGGSPKSVPSQTGDTGTTTNPPPPPPPSGGTPAGAYTVTVIATSGGTPITHSQKVTLTVQ